MESAARIVLIEDDDTIALGLVTALRHERYEVEHYDNGEDGLDAVIARPPDLLLLDVMLPGIDGLTVLRRLKAEHPAVQVVMLTARGEELDRVLGLEMGADDYVTKPFSLRELIARVKARLRGRPAETSRNKVPDTFSFDEVEVDFRRRVLRNKEVEHRLTTHEARVLGYLVANRGKDVARESLLEEVWGYSANMTTRTVDNQILKLRKKIEKVPSDPRHILTVHGTGYRFEE
ncbi:MAG: response regulator transcription factor [Alphaproteobacteria bacterium]|nr:response regulator transcription factor [Alphaproteobacteria bacterium]